MINGAAAAMYAALTVSAPLHGGVAQPHALDVIQVAADDPIPLDFAPVAGPAGSAISLGIMKVPLTGLRFVVFREISPDVTFSHGFRMKNSWIVAISDLEKLQVQVPPAFEGTMAFEALFHREKGAVAARGVVVVNVRGASSPREPERPEAQHPTSPVAGTLYKQEQHVGGTPKSMTVSSKEEEEELARGQKLVSGGDIATARLIFQNLAFRGSAPAARRLAETYDPRVLSRVAVAGLQPDIETARKWYKIAADAGDTEAASRLNLLAKFP